MALIETLKSAYAATLSEVSQQVSDVMELSLEELDLVSGGLEIR